MANVLSERIAELRRERGFTQEQLGQLVGVSAQAVSKWEKGGAPDVELLPALADRLGVTIDGLFDRECGETVDIQKVVGRWLLSLPDETRLSQVCRLLWGAFGGIFGGKVEMPRVDYLDHGEHYLDLEDNHGLKNKLMLSQIRMGGGIMLDLHAEDFSFATIWPEPQEGYAAYFAPKDQYRRLFEVLVKPGCLELLEYMYSRKRHFYIPNAMAAPLGLPCGQVESLMEELSQLAILDSMELELENGMVKAYSTYEDGAFVPFFYMARCLMQAGLNMINLFDRNDPILRGASWKDSEESDHE